MLYYAELQETVYEAELSTTGYSAELSEVIQMIDGRYQTKTATPSREAQVILPDEGYAALSAVTVDPIPSNYGLITWNGSTLTVS